MKITNVKIFPSPLSSHKLLCYARVEFDDGELRVSNVEIWQSQKDNQVRVGWPTRRWPNGTWSEVVAPNALLRSTWEDEILQAWRAHCAACQILIENGGCS